MILVTIVVGGFFSALSALIAVFLGYGLATVALTYLYVFLAFALSVTCMAYVRSRPRTELKTANEAGL